MLQQRSDLKHIKYALIICYLAAILMFALNNTFDFKTNYQFVQHVLLMDTTFNPTSVRSIHNESIYLIAYFIIIFWQYTTFVIGLVGFRKYSINGNLNIMNLSVIMGILLYFFGYIVIASEWFMMWQSSQWNAQHTAGMFSSLFILILIFINQPHYAHDD